MLQSTQGQSFIFTAGRSDGSATVTAVVAGAACAGAGAGVGKGGGGVSDGGKGGDCAQEKAKQKKHVWLAMDMRMTCSH